MSLNQRRNEPMSHTWEINGLSLELDLDDADNMKRYEDAFDLMAKEETEIPKDGRQDALLPTVSFSTAFTTVSSVTVHPSRYSAV